MGILLHPSALRGTSALAQAHFRTVNGMILLDGQSFINTEFLL
jgi:hypothetical protein